jgi:cellulose synthase (UDP-forming)
VTAKDESIRESPAFGDQPAVLRHLRRAARRLPHEHRTASIRSPTRRTSRFVVGGWNLLNLIIAGCALGVVSERSERAASRRVTVKRRCTFIIDGREYPSTLENVSANGARVQVFGLEPDLATGARCQLRFTPYGAHYEEALPVDVRNVENLGSVSAVGCRFMPEVARHHSLVADLIFANSNQWSDFQVSRRYNPGLFRGTLWFLGIALYQTSRGLLYFARSLGGARKGETTS